MRNTSVELLEGFKMLDDTPKAKTKTKAAMLLELESIKGLLLEEDDIPTLQEVMTQAETDYPNSPIATEHSEQQDFFQTQTIVKENTAIQTREESLKAPANEYPPITRTSNEKNINVSNRPSLTKASGENPFLPEHIRSRLHGNNPPPLFAHEAARKIARSNRPTQLLGNTQNIVAQKKSTISQQELINDIMDSILPELERELRERLEVMSKEMLEKLLTESNK